jgi:cyclopropane fatty-acyl-phospholipid synthase-like methyltransferase
MMVAILLLVMATLALVLAGSMVYLAAAARNEVPAVFTPDKTLPQVVKALDLPEHGKVVDLGCGDGRVLASIIRNNSKLVAIGVENNLLVWALARVRLKHRAKIERGDLRKIDLSGCDRVFAYLGPGMMAELGPKFERELRPGAKLVSQQFPLPGRKPDEVLDLAYAKPFANKLYVYHY